MKSHSTGTPFKFKIKLEYQNSKGPKIVFQPMEPWRLSWGDVFRTHLQSFKCVGLMVQKLSFRQVFAHIKGL